MKVIFSLNGDKVKPLEYESKAYRKVERIFNNLELDLLAVPQSGQGVSLAKDGVCIEAVVKYAHLNYFVKGNDIYRDDDEDRLYYFVALEKIEVVDLADKSILD